MYSSEHQAGEAIHALQELGYDNSAMTLLTQESLGHHITPERVADAVSDQGELLGSFAIAFARGLQNGHSVVIVNAPFGEGFETGRALDSAHPVDPGGPDAVTPRNPSPLSDLLGIPVLSNRGLSIWSKMFSPLARHNFSMFGSGLSNNPAPLSSMVGMKTVSTKGMGNSSMGLPLLKKQKQNWTRSFGFPLLTKKQ